MLQTSRSMSLDENVAFLYPDLETDSHIDKECTGEANTAQFMVSIALLVPEAVLPSTMIESMTVKLVGLESLDVGIQHSFHLVALHMLTLNATIFSLVRT